ncbi:MAG: hypothetical protein AABZ20_00865 [candidate division NC10 bacterium]
MTVAPGQPSSAGRVPPHPVCNAFLICDYAIREEGTGKVSLVGVFENINARSFPVTHGLLCVYAKLTDAEGNYEIRLELVRLEDLVIVGQGALTMTIEDRMVAPEIIFQLGGLVFERPGRYEFRLSANARSVAIKSFNVVQIP